LSCIDANIAGCRAPRGAPPPLESSLVTLAAPAGKTTDTQAPPARQAIAKN